MKEKVEDTLVKEARAVKELRDALRANGELEPFGGRKWRKREGVRSRSITKRTKILSKWDARYFPNDKDSVTLSMIQKDYLGLPSGVDIIRANGVDFELDTTATAPGTSDGLDTDVSESTVLATLSEEIEIAKYEIMVLVDRWLKHLNEQGLAEETADKKIERRLKRLEHGMSLERERRVQWIERLQALLSEERKPTDLVARNAGS